MDDDYRHYLGYTLLSAAIIGGLLTLWGFTLRRQLRHRTAQLITERLHLQTLVKTIPDLIWFKDENGVYLSCNPRCEQLFGAKEADIIGKTDYDFVDKELADFFRGHDRKAMEAGRTTVNEEWITFADDHYRGLFETIKTPMYDADGGLLGVLGIAHDISARKESERESAKNAMLLRTASDGIHVLDPDGNVVLASDAFCRMLGYAQEEVAGMNVAQWDAQWSGKELSEKVSDLIECENLFETKHRRRDGSIFDVEIHSVAVEMDGKKFLYASARDISERKRTAEQMIHLAHFDILTDLPNRVLLSDRLQQAVTKAKRDEAHMALMFIDLDKFKPVNDSLGHDVGDLLLKEVALRLQNCLRESDTVARIGGDEFVVLLPVVVRQTDALAVAQEILAALMSPFMLAGHNLHISASIGIAVYPEDGSDEDQLLKSADDAMYQTKERGGAATLMSEKLKSHSSR